MQKLFAMLLVLCLMCGLTSAGAEEPTLQVDKIAFDGISVFDIGVFEVNSSDEQVELAQELIGVEQSGNLGMIFIWYAYDAEWDARWKQWYTSYEEYAENGYYDLYSNCSIASENDTVGFPQYLTDDYSLKTIFQGSEVSAETTLFNGQQISIKNGTVMLEPIESGYAAIGGAYGFGFYYEGASYSVIFTNIEDPDKAIADIKEFVSKIRPIDWTAEDAAAQIPMEEEKMDDDDNAEDAAVQQYIVITNGTANIRAKADSKSDRITTAKKGDTFLLLGEEGTWYKIEINGQTAYVSQGLCEIRE